MTWLLLLGGAAWWLLSRAPKEDKPEPSPNPRPAPLPGGVAAPHFRQLKTVPDSLFVETGSTWLGEADVPFFAGPLVTESAIRDHLESKGILPITVSEKRPDFWPVLSDSDWYVVGTSISPAQTLDVPGAVVRIWEAVAG